MQFFSVDVARAREIARDAREWKADMPVYITCSPTPSRHCAPRHIKKYANLNTNGSSSTINSLQSSPCPLSAGHRARWRPWTASHLLQHSH
eukprot:2846882-Pleurochrysis_carterae.AAC.3